MVKTHVSSTAFHVVGFFLALHIFGFTFSTILVIGRCVLLKETQFKKTNLIFRDQFSNYFFSSADAETLLDHIYYIYYIARVIQHCHFIL